MKSIKTLLIITFVISLIMGLNYYIYKTSQTEPGSVFPQLPPKEGVLDIDWMKLEQNRDSIIGKRVRILGAGHLLKSGIINDEINYFVLMPPARADMCVPVAQPKIREMIYVDCQASPFPLSRYTSLITQSLPLLYVEGIFQPADKEYLFTLTNPIITPFE